MSIKKQIQNLKQIWNINKFYENKIFNKGNFISNTEIKNELKNFLKIYKQRPIKENTFGIQFPHMFATYIFLKKIRPKFVVESGVFKGQSTWLIEKVLPKTKLLCIDPDLSNREYISKKAKYSKIDFTEQDFSKIPKNSLVFFDDHQHAIERLIYAKWFNFKHVIFEDNYSWPEGDFYTIRKTILGTGFVRPRTKLKLLRILKILKSIFFEFRKMKKNKRYFISKQRLNDWFLDEKKPNIHEFKMLNKNVEIYFEFPPVLKLQKTAWGSKWSKDIPTKKPLFNSKEKNKIQIDQNELNSYNWICYLKLK